MKKILIVDDEDCIRLVLSEFLKNKGFTACEAKDGFEAISIFSRERPDAVLLDLSMPGMDGMEVLSRLTSQDPSIPVIILTANGEKSSAEKEPRAPFKLCRGLLREIPWQKPRDKNRHKPGTQGRAFPFFSHHS